MKKLALIVLILCCLPAVAGAAAPTPSQPKATVIWTGTAHDDVFAIARRGDELWAATNFGLFLKRKSDTEWKMAYSSPRNALLSMDFASSGEGVAVGQNGLILAVKPNSDQWSVEKSGVTNRLMTVAANSDGDFVAAGSFGTVLYRGAGTHEWQKVKVKALEGEEMHLYSALFLSKSTGVIVGENESILEIENGQITDQVQLGKKPKKGSMAAQEGETATPSLFGVTYCNGMLVAAGQRGLVVSKVLAPEAKTAPKADHKSSAAGKKNGLLSGWQSSRIPGDPDVYGLTCTQGGTLVGVGNNATIVVGSRQAGTDKIDWQPLHAEGLYAPWLSSALSSNGQGVMVAGPSRIWEVNLTDGK